MCTKYCLLIIIVIINTSTAIQSWQDHNIREDTLHQAILMSALHTLLTESVEH